jgi:hypothetical protein
MSLVGFSLDAYDNNVFLFPFKNWRDRRQLKVLPDDFKKVTLATKFLYQCSAHLIKKKVYLISSYAKMSIKDPLRNSRDDRGEIVSLF